jgi:L-ascorbate metabolism protein UlaG (beta-lactamase superfamily)
LQLGRPSANIVTLSHEAANHAALEGVLGEPRVIRGPGEYEIGGVMITGVATPGERLPSGEYGRNTAYSIQVDEISICHLGDLGKTLTTGQIEALKDPDVLLVPAGGHCTIGSAEVAEVVSQLEPKLVVPMHFSLPGLKVDLDEIEKFAREMGLQELRPQAKLTVTRSSLPDETTVALLEAGGIKRS